MHFIEVIKVLLILNVIILSVQLVYLSTKINRHASVPFLMFALVPMLAFALGTLLFTQSHSSSQGAHLITLGIALIPIGMTPLSHTLGRGHGHRLNRMWVAYYLLQTAILALFVHEIVNGRLIEWITGILDEPVIIIEKHRTVFFLNTIIACVVVLLSFDTTLKNATKAQVDALKFVFLAFLGFIVQFSYVSFNVLMSSYISQSSLLSGATIIFLALGFLSYTFLKHPFWEVKIHVSRRMVFGCLSMTAAIVYLIISGSVIDLLRLVQPQKYDALLVPTVFALVAVFLLVYLSPTLKNAAASFINRHFFRNKYDYRDLWMKFSEKSSGSLNIKDLLPKVAEFIADAMFIRQVVIWLPSTSSDHFTVGYCHDPISLGTGSSASLRFVRVLKENDFNSVYAVPKQNAGSTNNYFPLDQVTALNEMGITRLVLVEKNNQIMALLGVGAESGNKEPAAEDDQLLSSVSKQLGHLILNHKLSEELLLAREWESFNRFASFIVHDLKNLATLQSMTLENAKRLSHNPEFLSDAFTTFNQTTEKMINLIASLSVQRGQFTLKQQPVNILEIIGHTFDELKIEQRNGLKVITIFPPKETPPIISGDPELLRKAFTNLLLNAIQSLPMGEGDVEVKVSQTNNGKVTAEIRDSGCGIPPDQLQNLFRPFQTTKRQGMGIGLCHTRSIVEVHGGQMRIESRVNAGTKIELEFPTL